jgi:hypothetical protein
VPRLLDKPLAVYRNDYAACRITSTTDYRGLTLLLDKHKKIVSRHTCMRMLALFASCSGFPRSIPETVGRVSRAVLDGAISFGYGLTILTSALIGKKRVVKLGRAVKKILGVKDTG